MPKLCAICSEGGKWLPTPVNTLDAYLQKLIPTGTDIIPNASAYRKNLAYNIQYLQYLDQTLNELNLTSVLVTQTWKVFILVGAGIIEALLYYLLRSYNLQKRTEWELITKKSSNEFKLDGRLHKIENCLWAKLISPQDEDMSFESMIQKAETKKLLGNNHDIYKKLQYLRKLRNRVHLHLIEDERDTDWTKFNKKEITTMKYALFTFLTGKLFLPKASEKKMFSFLKSDGDA
jgi:hypothetical protein